MNKMPVSVSMIMIMSMAGNKTTQHDSIPSIRLVFHRITFHRIQTHGKQYGVEILS